MAIVNVPRELIPSTEWLSSNGKLEDNFPVDGCSRRWLDDEIIVEDKILIFGAIDYPLNMLILDDMNIQFIDMNIDGEHEINSHEDDCQGTLIIYLHKDEEIEDDFWVEDKKIEGRWDYDKHNYKALLFEGNVEHHGFLRGTGKRQLLVFFFNTPIEILNIPKSLVPSIEDLDEFSKYRLQKEYWGKETDMCEIQDFFTEKDIWKLFKNSLIWSHLSTKDFSGHYITYNVDEVYSIDEHHDSAYATLVICLQKDEDIEDDFWVEDHKIEGRWKYDGENYQALLMLGCKSHHGILRGSGRRKVIAFFFNRK